MLPMTPIRPSRGALLNTHSALAENPLLRPWTGPLGSPPFAAVRDEHFRSAFSAAIEEKRAEIAAIKANHEPASFENTILALERAGGALDRVAAVFFHLAGSDTNDEIQAIERELAPVLARERNADLSRRGPVSPRRAGLCEQRPERPRSRGGPPDRALSPRLRANGRGPAGGKESAARRDRRAAGDARGDVRTKRAGGRKGLSPGSRAAGSRGAAGRVPRRRRAGGDRAWASGQACGHAFALLDRAVPAILGAPRSQGKGVSGFRLARRERRRPRQRRRHERNRSVARGESPAAGLRDLRGLSARRHDGEDARSGLGPVASGLGAGARAGAAGRRGVAGDDCRRGRQFRIEAMGLALLPGAAASGAIRFRRGRAESASPAGADHRGRVPCRTPAVRPLLRRANRRRFAASGRARLERDRCERGHGGAVHRRLLRAPLQA